MTITVEGREHLPRRQPTIARATEPDLVEEEHRFTVRLWK